MSVNTPGPWRVPKHAPFQVEQEDAVLGSPVLAEVHEWEAGGRSKAERDANARLIAAAPDLLEAAKLAFMALEEGKDWSFELRDEAVAKLDDAIAKAEGAE